MNMDNWDKTKDQMIMYCLIKIYNEWKNVMMKLGLKL